MVAWFRPWVSHARRRLKVIRTGQRECELYRDWNQRRAWQYRTSPMGLQDIRKPTSPGIADSHPELHCSKEPTDGTLQHPRVRRTHGPTGTWTGPLRGGERP